jgi:DNA-binding MarR family transcriptional regulator
MPSSTTPTPVASGRLTDDDGPSRWPATHGDAWIGLLETHKLMTRALDAELESRHGLSLSGVEVLGRLAVAPGRCLRLSALAGETGLSLSRISRIIDLLQRRGLVDRQPCEADARAVEAHLTDAGVVLARETQATHFAFVQGRFFDHLSATELATLAVIFGRFTRRAAARCLDRA